MALTKTTTQQKGRVCFLSLDDVGLTYETDDHLAVAPLADLGWDVDFVSWRSNNKDVDWSVYNVVIIRSTWDYQDAPTEFKSVLRDIANLTRLENPLNIVEWNMSKQIYLPDLESKGVAVVPSLYSSAAITPALFEDWKKHFDTDEIIIKPVIGASAGHTYRWKDLPTDLPIVFDGSLSYMVQPFMKRIVEEGEFSLFFFGGELSHVTIKNPKKGDFRVQEEHGGTNILLQNPSKELLAAGEHALDMVGRTLLYARVDLVRTTSGKEEYLLMELELIEPSLYMRLDADAPKRFAQKIDEWLS